MSLMKLSTPTIYQLKEALALSNFQLQLKPNYYQIILNSPLLLNKRRIVLGYHEKRRGGRVQ